MYNKNLLSNDMHYYILLGLLTLTVSVAALRADLSSEGNLQSLQTKHRRVQQLSNAGNVDSADNIYNLKPNYHITPEIGWLNDPNGMFTMNGLTHVFYQLNPIAPIWDSPYWGHVVSVDLAYWARLPHALKPDTFYDIDGVFSGSATFDDQGRPTLLYTGVSNHTEYGYYYQQQALAVPSNLSDPLLVSWTKSLRPIITAPPPGGDNSQFRDPTTAWRVAADQMLSPASEGDLWVIAVGAQDDCVGVASLYAATNLTGPWNYVGPLMSQLQQDNYLLSKCVHWETGSASAMLGNISRHGPIAGPCNQFGDCRMWECPDLFPIPGSDVQFFKYSDNSLNRSLFAQDWYMLSNSKLSYMAADESAAGGYGVASNLSQAAMLPVLNGRRTLEKLLDYGIVYASKAFNYSDGRRLWYGWVYETSNGCTGTCATGGTITALTGWQGVMTLPRTVTYDPSVSDIVMYPAVEVEGLRSGLLWSGVIDLRPGNRSVAALNVTNSSSITNVTTGSWLYIAPILAAAEEDEAMVYRPVFSNGSVIPGGSELFAKDLPHLAKSASLGRQMEIQANYSLYTEAYLNGTFSFLLGLAVVTSEQSYTLAYLNGTAVTIQTEDPSPAGSDSHPRSFVGPAVQILDLSVYLDTAASGGMSTSRLDGGSVSYSVSALNSSSSSGKSQQLSLSIFLDHSLLEVFANKGRGRVTSRHYPMDPEAVWYLEVVAELPANILARADVSVWEMDDCWIDVDEVLESVKRIHDRGLEDMDSTDMGQSILSPAWWVSAVLLVSWCCVAGWWLKKTMR